MRFFVLISDQKSFCFCVPATKAKQILFLYPMNKKVVGGKHNILVQYPDASAPDSEGVLFSNPFIWDILWFILIKNLVFCVPTTLAKLIFFRSHMNKKVAGGKHNILIHYADASAPDPEGVLFCNTFKWDILLCVHIHFLKSLKCVLCVSLHCEIPVGLED